MLFPFLFHGMGYDVWGCLVVDECATPVGWMPFSSFAKALCLLHLAEGGLLHCLKHIQVPMVAKASATHDAWVFTYHFDFSCLHPL